MRISTITDTKGRLYQAIVEDGDDMAIPIGPPEGLVDEFMPEPFATKFHNILHRRGLLNYSEVQKHPKELQGALQELFMLDSQRLAETYFRYENEGGKNA